MPASSTELLRKAVRGGAVTFTAQFVRLFLQIAATVVLARLLPPSAFGVVAMVAAILVILDIVKEFGLSSATIQRPEISQAQLSGLFWLNLGLGAALALALWLLAPALAGLYGEPALGEIIPWLALGFVISAATVQHWALLRRQMRFTSIAVLETGAELSALALAIFAAANGAGYWALVLQRLTAPLIVMIGSYWLCGWMPSLPTRTPGFGALVRYGGSVTGYNLIAVASRSVDQILVGALWGAATLGLYERASKLLIAPLNNINAPLYAVAMPTFSRLTADPLAYRRTFVAMIEILAMLTMPAAAFLACIGDLVTLLAFGRNWMAAAPYVSLFALSAMHLPALLNFGLLYLTQDRTPEMLRAGAIDAGLVLGCLAIGIPFGPVGVAMSYALGGLLLRLPLAAWLSTRRGPVTLPDVVLAMLPALMVSAIVAASTLALRRGAWPDRFAPAPEAALAALAAILVALLAFALIPRSRARLQSLFKWIDGHRAGDAVELKP